ncbi:hypothetical protein EQ718_12495 [Paracoccus versutus]|uniref:Uncharacterized protein n=1 Tax=Paracoccus versutus TaxID=34007 RepID=A0AAQ0HC07_PARVE|nr:hypothetical protein [Paracoccus versutus]REG26910.1 hypothetical protein ATH84_10812 [Paracoccus versutus]WEJ79621.1 hypothetical protein EQ718_12495 [Paracoccus versutus]
MLGKLIAAVSLVSMLSIGAACAQDGTQLEQFPIRDDCANPVEPHLKEGCAFLDELLAAFIGNDAEKFADINHYPHVRITNQGTKIWDTRDDYYKDNTAEILAAKEKSERFPGWVNGRWEKRQLIQFDDSQMHFAVYFSRLPEAKPIRRRSSCAYSPACLPPAVGQGFASRNWQDYSLSSAIRPPRRVGDRQVSLVTYSGNSARRRPGALSSRCSGWGP